MARRIAEEKNAARMIRTEIAAAPATSQRDLRDPLADFDVRIENFDRRAQSEANQHSTGEKKKKRRTKRRSPLQAEPSGESGQRKGHDSE
jgi:hypothetical protein